MIIVRTTVHLHFMCASVRVYRTGGISPFSSSYIYAIWSVPFYLLFLCAFYAVRFFSRETALFWSINWSKSNSIGIGSVNHFEWYELDIPFSALLELISVLSGWQPQSNNTVHCWAQHCYRNVFSMCLESIRAKWYIFESHKWNKASEEK